MKGFTEKEIEEILIESEGLVDKVVALSDRTRGGSDLAFLKYLKQAIDTRIILLELKKNRPSGRTE